MDEMGRQKLFFVIWLLALFNVITDKHKTSLGDILFLLFSYIDFFRLQKKCKLNEKDLENTQ